MKLNLPEKLKTSQVLLVLLPSEIYTKRMGAIRKQLARSYKRICYVTLNKMYSPLVDEMKRDGIDPQKFFFIDGVTSSVTGPLSVKNCFFLKSPGDLTYLGIACSEACKKNPEVVCFDSLSTLLIYNPSPIVTRFIRDIVGKIRLHGVKAIFTALVEDTTKQTVREVGMFVDEIVRVK